MFTAHASFVTGWTIQQVEDTSFEEMQKVLLYHAVHKVVTEGGNLDI